MIGLAKGLAWQAYRDTHPGSRDWIEWYRQSTTFGLVPRSAAKTMLPSRGGQPPEPYYKTSARYYELVDKCSGITSSNNAPDGSNG